MKDLQRLLPDIVIMNQAFRHWDSRQQQPTRNFLMKVLTKQALFGEVETKSG